MDKKCRKLDRWDKSVLQARIYSLNSPVILSHSSMPQGLPVPCTWHILNVSTWLAPLKQMGEFASTLCSRCNKSPVASLRVKNHLILWDTAQRAAVKLILTVPLPLWDKSFLPLGLSVSCFHTRCSLNFILPSVRSTLAHFSSLLGCDLTVMAGAVLLYLFKARRKGIDYQWGKCEMI